MGKRPPKASVEVGRDGVVVEEAESGPLKRLCDSQPSLVKEVQLVWNLEGSLYKRYHCLEMRVFLQIVVPRTVFDGLKAKSASQVFFLKILSPSSPILGHN